MMAVLYAMLCVFAAKQWPALIDQVMEPGPYDSDSEAEDEDVEAKGPDAGAPAHLAQSRAMAGASNFAQPGQPQYGQQYPYQYPLPHMVPEDSSYYPQVPYYSYHPQYGFYYQPQGPLGSVPHLELAKDVFLFDAPPRPREARLLSELPKAGSTVTTLHLPERTPPERQPSPHPPARPPPTQPICDVGDVPTDDWGSSVVSDREVRREPHLTYIEHLRLDASRSGRFSSDALRSSASSCAQESHRSWHSAEAAHSDFSHLLTDHGGGQLPTGQESGYDFSYELTENAGGRVEQLRDGPPRSGNVHRESIT